MCVVPLLIGVGLIWFGMGEQAVFRLKLPTYASAQEVANAYYDYGASAGYQVVYFWTEQPIDEVRAYYETFTQPFAKVSYLNTEVPTYRSVFNPSGKPLPVVTDEFSRETLDLAQTGDCYYRLPYECIRVLLFDFSEIGSIDLPVFNAGRAVRTPAPLAPTFHGGTLIVYSYFVSDIS